ncbi:MAG: FmdB family transcriptional regulator [Ardenticatenaceae bacterium]|nr:FmdB family transcriptional regulator [Ardenticatenaceae bacterium]
MPLYTYRCNDCNHEFEARQRMSDDPLTECPVCEGEVRRVVNSVGVVFKGSGFYVTDNRSGKAKNSNATTKKDDASESSNGNTTSSSTDSSSTTPAETAPKKSEKATAATTTTS